MTFLEFALFGQQLGLALAGASALWGFVFIRKGLHRHHGDVCLTFDWVAQKLLYPFYGGALIALVSFIAILFSIPVFAHEGIVLTPHVFERVNAVQMLLPVFAVWIALLLPLGLLRHLSPSRFHSRFALFYAVHFVFIFFLISFPAWVGDFSARQFFFMGHSFHSIFTLGTVLVLDFLFLISKSSLHLKRHIYPFFPTISAVILVGLGFDFMSVGLVFSEAVSLTPKFFFMQTVLGILLINGALLAGLITRQLLHASEHREGKLSKRWEFIGDVAGTISIASWFTITFVDYFAGLTLGYVSLLFIYLMVLGCAIVIHLLWNRLQEDPISEQLREWHQ